jgi:hypothetical protein
MTMLKMKWDQCILWKSLHGRRAKENEAQARFRRAAPRRAATEVLRTVAAVAGVAARPGVPAAHCSLSGRLRCAALRRIRFALRCYV